MKFSIITCTYNSEKFLQKNIDSVKSQTFKDYEHVFIDGNSNDSTIEIIKKYKEDYPDRVKFFQSEPKGISNAMNKGVERASGEFLIHLHSDDSFYDDKVLEDVNVFLEKNKSLDWIYGLANVIEENGENILIYPDKPNLHFNNSKSFIGRYLMKILTFVPHQAVFIKKSVFEKFGNFDESISSKMDRDFWFRIRNKTKWSFFNRVICNFCVRIGAQSSSKEKVDENMKNLEEVQKRHMNKIELFFIKILNRIKAKRNKNNR